MNHCPSDIVVELFLQKEEAKEEKKETYLQMWA